VRASYGEGFRFPTIAEKYIRTSVGPMNIYPNNDITAEKSWNAEFGIKQGLKFGKFYGYLDAAVFQQEIHNSIEFNVGRWGGEGDPLFGLGFKSINVGLARIRGLDFSLVGKGKVGPFDINILAGHTFTIPITLTPDATISTRYVVGGNAQDEPDPNASDTLTVTYSNSSSDNTGNILKYRFQHLTKVDVNVLYKKFAFGVSFRYNSFMQNVDNIFIELDENSGVDYYEGILPTGIKQYRDERYGKGDYVVDIRVRYELNETTKVSLIVNNLLNREYMIRPLKIESPRTGQLMFTIHF
jgi:iron complex outermembrane receptor protein